VAERPLIARLSDRFFLRIRHRRAWGSATDPPTGTLDSLRGHKYCLLTTFRRSGEPVPTPVWFGLGDDGRLYLRSETVVGKVKRVRNDPRVRVAPCTMRGKPQGPPVEGRARLLPQEEEERAERAIAANYGAFRRMYERVGEGAGAELVYIEVAPA
jgi:PPOX class probable F420-dependent enzyme